MLNKKRKPLLVLAVAAVLCAATAGCTSPDHKAETTSPVPQVSTPSAEESQAVADATAALNRFYQVLDQCMADPQNAGPSCLDAVAVDQVLTDYRSTIDALKNEGWHYQGEPEVQSVEVVWVNLDGPSPQVRLAACVDQRTWRLVDDSGMLLDPESAMPTASQRVMWQLINYDYPNADQWKVSFYPGEASSSC